MSALDWVAFVLLIMGALNWGVQGVTALAGQGRVNVLNLVLGSVSVLENLVYLLVGVAALYKLYKVFAG